jgi:hypothetical protein
VSTDPDFWGSAPLSAAMAAMKFDPHAPTAVQAMIPIGPSEFTMNVAKNSGLPLETYNFRGTETDWTVRQPAFLR